MYLLVFVTLVVALTGIYGEVLAVQTKQLYANQTGIADAMQAWHNSALALIKSATPAITNFSGVGCSLTQTSPSYQIVSCSNGGAVTLGAGTWPPGNQYTFYSVYFQSSNKKYVVTFVPPPQITNPPPGFVMLPGAPNGGTQLGITMSDLIAQIKKSSMSSMYYGTVNASGNLAAGSISNGLVTTPMNYAVPTAVPINAIAIISTAN